MIGKHTTLLKNLSIHLGDCYGTDVENKSPCFVDMEYEHEHFEGEPEYFVIYNIRLMHPGLLTYDDKFSIMIDTTSRLEYCLTDEAIRKIETQVLEELKENISYNSFSEPDNGST